MVKVDRVDRLEPLTEEEAKKVLDNRIEAKKYRLYFEKRALENIKDKDRYKAKKTKQRIIELETDIREMELNLEYNGLENIPKHLADENIKRYTVKMENIWGKDRWFKESQKSDVNMATSEIKEDDETD